MLTSGFFNSINHDRKYDAVQMSSIFDGIIQDGVFQSIGSAFHVSAAGANLTVNVGTGRAWFNHTWTLNDAVLPLTIVTPHATLKRVDAVVLEVNTEDAVRNNSIKIISGTVSSSPAKPTLSKGPKIWQYPLAYITVAPNAQEITQANIENAVGTSACPYVKAPLDKMSIDDLLAQWQNQFDQRNDELVRSIEELKNNLQNKYDTWVEDLKDALDDNTALGLANSINEVKEQLPNFVNKSGDTMTGTLVTPGITVAGVDMTITSEQYNALKTLLGGV